MYQLTEAGRGRGEGVPGWESICICVREGIFYFVNTTFSRNIYINCTSVSDPD
jgi:hypothetical protein